MRKYELEERTIKISEALEPEQRFEKKDWETSNMSSTKKTGVRLHWIKLNLEKRAYL